MQILRRSDFAKLAWKNGLGISHVIASDPPLAGYDRVDWQVGTTAFGIDCPFSSLPNMDRQFTLLSGDGVELHCIDVIAGIDVRHAVNTPFLPFAFRGDWQTTCRMLGEPVRVFNVMTRRGKAAARITMPRWTGPLYCDQRKGEKLVAVLLAGNAQVAGESLAADDAVLLNAPEGEHCEIVSGGDSRMAVVRITPA
jgi:environmental stress-induced protein Ves